MNHLLRELAPIADAAWTEIEAEAERSLKHFLAARRLVDFAGPEGWSCSSVDLGRVVALEAGPVAGTEAALRAVAPLVELRTPFTVARSEIAAADRGSDNLDLDSLIAGARAAAMAEDGAVFHGFAAGGITGMTEASPHAPITIGEDFSHYPQHVGEAVAKLRAADVAGPYAIALGDRPFRGVSETTEHGGYPVFEHLRQILGGPVVWAPAVDGAVVLSQRGGDFEITVGEDLSIGYLTADAVSVELYFEESLTFRVNSPEAAIHLVGA